MKAKILLLCLLASSAVYAQNISVNIDGVTYECSDSSTPVTVEPHVVETYVKCKLGFNQPTLQKVALMSDASERVINVIRTYGRSSGWSNSEKEKCIKDAKMANGGRH